MLPFHLLENMDAAFKWLQISRDPKAYSLMKKLKKKLSSSFLTEAVQKEADEVSMFSLTISNWYFPPNINFNDQQWSQDWLTFSQLFPNVGIPLSPHSFRILVYKICWSGFGKSLQTEFSKCTYITAIITDNINQCNSFFYLSKFLFFYLSIFTKIKIQIYLILYYINLLYYFYDRLSLYKKTVHNV